MALLDARRPGRAAPCRRRGGCACQLSRAELEALIYKGNLYRTTEATNVNEVSSRSHAVLQLYEMTLRFDPSAGTRCGKLYD